MLRYSHCLIINYTRIESWQSWNYRVLITERRSNEFFILHRMYCCTMCAFAVYPRPDNATVNSLTCSWKVRICRFFHFLWHIYVLVVISKIVTCNFELSLQLNQSIAQPKMRKFKTPIRDKTTLEKPKLWNVLKRQAAEFCKETGLHGYKYISQTQRSKTERYVRTSRFPYFTH